MDENKSKMSCSESFISTLLKNYNKNIKCKTIHIMLAMHAKNRPLLLIQS